MPRNPYYNPQRYHHTESGFRNPPGSKIRPGLNPRSAREGARFAAELMRLAGDNPFPDDHVLDEETALRLYHQIGDCNKLLWLGHASFLIQLGHRTLLTDPYLTDYASPVPSRSTRRLITSAIAIENLPVVTDILISHNHYDHLDIKALRKLSRRFGDASVYVPLGLKSMVGKQGFGSVKGNNIHELDWYDDHRENGLSVMAVPAIHTSRRGLNDNNLTLWCGFVIELEKYRVYFAGDTAYGPVFKDEMAGRIGPLDLGLVPIGAYQPRYLMEAVHATPEEAIAIGEDLGISQLIGMHWGTVRLTTEPMLEPRDRFLAAQSSVPRRVLRIGETVSLPAQLKV